MRSIVLRVVTQNSSDRARSYGRIYRFHPQQAKKAAQASGKLCSSETSGYLSELHGYTIHITVIFYYTFTTFTPIQSHRQNYNFVFSNFYVFTSQTRRQKVLHWMVASISQIQFTLNFLINQNFYFVADVHKYLLCISPCTCSRNQKARAYVILSPFTSDLSCDLWIEGERWTRGLWDLDSIISHPIYSIIFGLLVSPLYRSTVMGINNKSGSRNFPGK
jgi:hypothetical protein